MVFFGDNIMIGQNIISAVIGAFIGAIPAYFLANSRDRRNRYIIAINPVVKKLFSEIVNINKGFNPSGGNFVAEFDILFVMNLTSKRHSSKIKKAWDSYTESVDQHHWVTLASGKRQFNNLSGYKTSIEKLIKTIKKH